MRGERRRSSQGSNVAGNWADLQHGEVKEHFWGCELTKDKPSVTWSFEEEDGDQDFLLHYLFLKHAVLGGAVKDGEKQIVQVQTKTFSGEEVKQPLLSLTSGKKDMCLLDMSFYCDTAVTFKLEEGSGPVYLCAMHNVEVPSPECEEGEFTEEELTETEGEDSMLKAKSKKRKAPSQAAKKSKRGKMDSENGTEEDESMDAEDEVDDEDEDSEEDEEEEEEEDEEDEDEESPDEGGKKGKGKKKGSDTPKSKAAAAKSKVLKSAEGKSKLTASGKKVGKKAKK